MTEASPVTHVGYLDPALYRPDRSASRSRRPTAACSRSPKSTPPTLLDDLTEAPSGQPGELVMRGPQFMLGYWKEPQATAAVLRDGWYWSGDIVTRDDEDFYRVLDRRKEMIKYKGFPVAPAEVEAVLLEHPAVSDCGVVGRPDAEAGEIPVAFVVLRDGFVDSENSEKKSAASSPTASPTTSSRAKSASSTPSPKTAPEKFCAANSENPSAYGSVSVPSSSAPCRTKK